MEIQPNEYVDSEGKKKKDEDGVAYDPEDNIQEPNELSGDQGRPQGMHLPSASSVTQINEPDEVVITNIRVTDAAFGLRRIPAGFYSVIYHNDVEWRTKNKRVSVDNDIVEWDGPVPILSDPSATVGFTIYASFELQPTLGSGEQLQKLTITVKQLLEYSAKSQPFFFPKDGDVISPCSSLFVAISRGEHMYDGSSVSRVIDPHLRSSTIESEYYLVNATNKGHSFLSRYRKHEEKVDVEHSIEEFEHALYLCPVNHPCYAAALSNLAMARFVHCQIDKAGSLDIPIDLYLKTLNARPVGHLDRPLTLIQLAAVYFARYKKRRREDDAVEAEALSKEAIDLAPSDSHESRAGVFMLQLHAQYQAHHFQTGDTPSTGHDLGLHMDPLALAVRLLNQYERSRKIEEVQEAILVLERLLQSISFCQDHRYTASLSALGVAFMERYDGLGDLGDLEHGIMRMRDADELTPDHHLDKPARLNNLGGALQTRFERLGDLGDLEDGITRLRDAVELTPDHQLDKRGARLSRLGIALQARFECLGELDDIEEGITRLRDAVELTPDHHSDKPGRLNNLGNALRARFESLGELGDLEDGITRHRDAVELTPDHHPDKPGRLTNLGNALVARFERLGELSDLEDAITSHRDAVELTPDHHPDKPGHLNNLGNTLRARFKRLGELGDLEEGITRLRDAVELTPDHQLDKRLPLNNLGIALQNRFERLGELSDLEEGITRLRDAVELTPDHHPHKLGYLNNLADALRVRFERLGELGDLEDGITRHRGAVELIPDYHPHRPALLNNLGNALRVRFERLGELGDIEDGITRLRDAVELTPDHHPDKPTYLHNLSNALQARFERLGELSDLEDGIARHRDAVKLTPDHHPDKPGHLSNLGNALRARFRRLGELGDLEDGIMRLRDAVELTPDYHPDKPGHLNNLGNALRARFERLGELGDLEDGITRHRDAAELTPDHHPHRPALINNLGGALQARFERLGELGDLEDAISQFSYSAFAVTGPTVIRLNASYRWISCARRWGHHSLLKAYFVAIDILPQLAWVGLPLVDRYRQLFQGAGVVREAAAAALALDFPETAVEWLEQGRSIVWGDLFRLRSSYDELLHAHPNHAHKLQELSAQLEHAGAAREKSLSLLSEQTPRGAEGGERDSLMIQADRQRQLAIKRDKLLQEIRSFPGFERFLLRTEFSTLRRLAHSGPVVILNAAKERCDALIIIAGVEKANHVPLPHFNLGRSTGLLSTLKSLIGPYRCEERVGKRREQGNILWEGVLSVLWNDVVKPILDALTFSTPGDLSRIFWCPTGPFTFLPIHAAGLYGAQYSEPGHKVSDFVISSYIPTLSILAPSTKPDASTRENVRLLAVPQPATDGQKPLLGVRVELQHIRTVIDDCPPGRISLSEPNEGTVEEVLLLMMESDWVHFACHGVQDNYDPTTSGLCLAGGRRLKISDIVGLSRPRGGLAFLSACQTAMGDEKLSDEAIHIAAGMLFAGYGGVVGSMWSISDELAPKVARDVYEELFQDGGVPDHRNAARALHNAMLYLREKEPFSAWLPFIHVGL